MRKVVKDDKGNIYVNLNVLRKVRGVGLYLNSSLIISNVFSLNN